MELETERQLMDELRIDNVQNMLEAWMEIQIVLVLQEVSAAFQERKKENMQSASGQISLESCAAAVIAGTVKSIHCCTVQMWIIQYLLHPAQQNCYKLLVHITKSIKSIKDGIQSYS